jgi:general secretion pathway protein C
VVQVGSWTEALEAGRRRRGNGREDGPDEATLNHNRPMVSRLLAFVLWALAAASAVYWGLRLTASPLAVPSQAMPVVAQVGSPGAVVRMLGGGRSPTDPAQSAPPPESSRFRLLGVMAPPEGRSGPGVALLSIDGKPPRAYALGSVVEGELTLQALGQRSATFGRGSGGAAFTLELPPLPPPQTGAPQALPPDQGIVPVAPAPRPDGGDPAIRQ